MIRERIDITSPKSFSTAFQIRVQMISPTHQATDVYVVTYYDQMLVNIPGLRWEFGRNIWKGSARSRPQFQAFLVQLGQRGKNAGLRVPIGLGKEERGWLAEASVRGHGRAGRRGRGSSGIRRGGPFLCYFGIIVRETSRGGENWSIWEGNAGNSCEQHHVGATSRNHGMLEQ